ncbi:GTP cyclohydrolase I [Subtercola boreus]|uniref:GTP cyclohydrolase I n=1 Tax=Subtercola boreus TaxID=120213 RepID=UPI003F58F92C
MNRQRIEAAVLELIEAIGEDPQREGLVNTPRRVAEAYSEFFAGVGADARQALGETYPFDGSAPPEPVLVRGLAFRSVCEHHLLPFRGVAHVAYVPDDRLIGLGRIPAVIEVLANRPQLQERLGEEIASTLSEALDAAGVLVVLEASHGCVTMRGPQQAGSTTVTVASRGTLSEPAARAELMGLIGASAFGARAGAGMAAAAGSAAAVTAAAGRAGREVSL